MPGSRTVASSFPGVSCLESVRYGFVHGPSPAVAEVVISGQPTVQVGQEHSIQIDQSMFYGYITNIHYDYENYSTSIRMVDWRDRLRDVMVFCAWNMTDESGLFYHIERENWETQTKTWINKRWLEAIALNQLINDPGNVMADEVSFFEDRLKSSWIILKELCDHYNIELIADEQVEERLKTTFPDNVDANGGSYLTDIFEYVISKAACQFSCYGQNLMLITVRGQALNGMANLIEASLANPCSTGAKNTQIGEELNENGRRVRLVGDQNQYEWIFLCRADWNQTWTFGFTYNNWEYPALLQATGLSGHDKVNRLPAAYHDSSYWPIDDFEERQQGPVWSKLERNDLTIAEYLQKIPYRVYRVDPSMVFHDGRQPANAGKPFSPTVAAEYAALKWKSLDPDMTRHRTVPDPIVDPAGFLAYSDKNFFQVDPSQLPLSEEERQAIDEAIAAGNPIPPPQKHRRCIFRYPLSQSLVTNTFKQFTCYGSTFDIPEGWNNPFAKQYCMVPLESGGVSLQIEEVDPSNVTHERGWIVRLIFSQPQLFVDPLLTLADPKRFKPDWVACRLSISREIYQYLKGELGINLRVREKKVQVRNLFKGFSNGNELPTIRELSNRAGLVRNGVAKTDDVADAIARKMLSNRPITLSGGMLFEQRAGMIPDGLVDSVSVEFNQTNGITEQINFTTASNTDDSFVGPSRIRVQDNERLRNEIISDRLQAMNNLALKTKDGIVKAMAFAELGMRQWGGLVGNVLADKAFGRDGVVHAIVEQATLADEVNIAARTILPANRNLGPHNPPIERNND